VLIKDVEIVQGPEDVIPSLIRFYGIHNETSDRAGGFLYQSSIDCTYKFISGFSDWKSSVGIVPSKAHKNDFIDGNIKCRFEIVEGVTDYQREIIWQGFSFRELENIISGLGVFLDAETVKVTCGEIQNATVKVSDVMLGPFNL
jgi:hypothetical protein